MERTVGPEILTFLFHRQIVADHLFDVHAFFDLVRSKFTNTHKKMYEAKLIAQSKKLELSAVSSSSLVQYIYPILYLEVFKL